MDWKKELIEGSARGWGSRLNSGWGLVLEKRNTSSFKIDRNEVRMVEDI